MNACVTTGHVSLTSPFAIQSHLPQTEHVNTDPNCQVQTQVELKYQALVIGICVH